MWSVLVMFVLLSGLVTLIAACYQSRRQLQARLAALGGGGGGGTELPTGGRLAAAVAAESRSGRHIIIVAPPGAGGAAAAAARVRQMLPNGKLPTPARLIANLPTYEYRPPLGAAGGGAGEGEAEKGAGGAGGEGGAAAAAADGGGGGGGGDDADEVCVICCDAFEAGARVKLLPCMHKYHSECIDAWLMRDTHCPNCRESVILAAGMSEAEALDLAVAAAAAHGVEPEAARRRQIDGPARAGRNSLDGLRPWTAMGGGARSV